MSGSSSSGGVAVDDETTPPDNSNKNKKSNPIRPTRAKSLGIMLSPPVDLRYGLWLIFILRHDKPSRVRRTLSK